MPTSASTAYAANSGRAPTRQPSSPSTPAATAATTTGRARTGPLQCTAISLMPTS
ncbi:hypothetical protein LO762_16980 [Actinocorallia sp. API 0066]|uniref:hypothetical protein n=1 Tax=Actinocorallia sp. API 0066 TaxID=2896846 RepID=UPI001E2BDCF2|nr:hypothetical protein [Actinocorallia sp. API 0066]MCD0450875.1 hypothetical protein [Actinocorallia sp. API 0066]